MAAPFATMQLADLGARVIKVENPAGPDPTRTTGPFLEGPDGRRHSSPFARLNRNKESVALDLKSDAGRSAFLRLAARADALVENLRPGALRRLGLGPDELAEVNPGLVYASASGFGQDGPLAALPGLDIMAQARGGLMSITGTARRRPGQGRRARSATWSAASTPRWPWRPRCAPATATGAGQNVDVSLLESGVSLAVWEAGKLPGHRGGRAARSARRTRPRPPTRRCAAPTAA